MKLGEFCRHLADQSGVSIVVADSLENRTVTMEVKEQAVGDVLSFVARRLEVAVRLKGNMYFLGVLKPEDRGVLVRRVRRLDQKGLESVLGVFRGEHGGAVSFADGLVVVGDSVEVLGRVGEMLDMIELVDSPVWVVQLHIVGYSREAADDLGVNFEPAAKAGLAFAAGSAIGAAKSSWELSASLDAVLRVAHSREDVQVTAAPMWLMGDGRASSFVQGDRIPIPRQNVSDQGTVTTVGFDYVQTGVQVKATLREVAAESAMLDVEVSMSDVKRFVQEAPVTGEETFKTGCAVKGGGVYLLGTLVKDRASTKEQLGWQSGQYGSTSAQVVQVWAQCYRIAGTKGLVGQAGGMQVQPLCDVVTAQPSAAVSAAAAPSSAVLKQPATPGATRPSPALPVECEPYRERLIEQGLWRPASEAASGSTQAGNFGAASQSGSVYGGPPSAQSSPTDGVSPALSSSPGSP